MYENVNELSERKHTSVTKPSNKIIINKARKWKRGNKIVLQLKFGDSIAQFGFLKLWTKDDENLEDATNNTFTFDAKSIIDKLLYL